MTLPLPLRLRLRLRAPSGAQGPLRRRGFVLLEVLIASIVIVVGFLAVFALQFAALDANVNAMRYTEATNVAEAWMGVLHREALMWNQRGGVDMLPGLMPNLTNGATLPPAPDATLGWRIATLHAGGMAVDKNLATGSPNNPGFIYCVHQRLTWIDVRDGNNLFSAEMLRAEVRVLWPRRERGTLNTPSGDFRNCGGAAPDAMAGTIADVVSITVPTVVAWNPLP
ncbi:MAG TPA: hypothetical protein VG389_14925 [Myxococcota bacterium]|jgi:hypothetical protein|nr:hypothetical protein [Myxococcota bacterium]